MVLSEKIKTEVFSPSTYFKDQFKTLIKEEKKEESIEIQPISFVEKVEGGGVGIFNNFFTGSNSGKGEGSSSSSKSSGPTVLTDDICLLHGEVPEVRIEEAPMNSRRIFTAVDILADVNEVWQLLTTYETLQNVVPSLVKNEVIFRTPEGGARLLQVGGAKVLPGITFKATTVLDICVYKEDKPMPQEMLMSNVPEVTASMDVRAFYRNIPLKRDVFPRPYAISSLPHRDITMQVMIFLFT
jgi:hypothetical protein